MYIDSHAHCAELPSDQLNDILGRSIDASVATIVNVATDLPSSYKIVEQIRKNQSAVTLYGSAGISAPEVDAVVGDWEQELRKLLSFPEIVAVGEIGIDSINSSYPPIEQQRPFFVKQLQLAKEFDLPAIIHARGAEAEALLTCVELGVEKALFHCFTGTLDEAIAIVEAGYVISFSGIVTFKSSNYDDMIRSIPSDQILFETDSPYLSPVPVRGTVNEPANVSHVYRYAAAVRGVTPEHLAVQCQATFGTLFASNC